MPIRTAIIGYGLAGRVFHAPLIAADPGFALTTVVTSDADRARRATTTYPGAATVPTVDALLDRADDLDLVVVASPNETHAPLAHRALDAGLDVVVDKPVAIRSAEAREIVEHADAAGRRFSVFQNRRWDGDFLTVADAVRSGLLGEVRQLESAFEWWKPARGSSWKDTTGVEQGGGITYDLAPHLVDQALLLFGPVTAVHAELDRRRSGAVNDDDSFLSLTHASGVRSRLWMSAVSPHNRPRFRVVGAQAELVTWGLDPQEDQLSAGTAPGDPGYGMFPEGTATLTGPDGTTPLAVRTGDYPAFYRAWAEGQLPVDPRDSLAALEIIEQAVREAR